MKHYYCPSCGRDDLLTVDFDVLDWGDVIHCPRCGKFSVDQIAQVKSIEKLT